MKPGMSRTGRAQQLLAESRRYAQDGDNDKAMRALWEALCLAQQEANATGRLVVVSIDIAPDSARKKMLS